MLRARQKYALEQPYLVSDVLPDEYIWTRHDKLVTFLVLAVDSQSSQVVWCAGVAHHVLPASAWTSKLLGTAVKAAQALLDGVGMGDPVFCIRGPCLSLLKRPSPEECNRLQGRLT